MERQQPSEPVHHPVALRAPPLLDEEGKGFLYRHRGAASERSAGGRGGERGVPASKPHKLGS